MAIRVLIVDDSRIARRVLSSALSKDPEILVIDSASDAIEASDKIESLKPDVITLDLQMPKMDGLTFLRGLMRHYPLPVVVVSAYTAQGSKLALEALELGAVDIVTKPGMGQGLDEMAAELIAKVKAGAQAHFASASKRGTPRAAGEAVGATRRFSAGTQPSLPVLVLQHKVDPDRVIAIGSSTGGTTALQDILTVLPADMPPILITQHMPPGFTLAFANRLNGLCAMEVKEAAHNDTVRFGHVYIAPGGKHIALRRSGGRYWLETNEGPKVHRQRPSVEVLFQSVAKVAGPKAVGAILTGMGGDGAEGLLAMRQAGATTLAQDEKSCVVFGMPKEAIRLGGAQQVVALSKIAQHLVNVA